MLSPFYSNQPFPTHSFTSTLHEESIKSSINLWVVVTTAIFFFLILSWYNFLIALYEFSFNITSDRNEKIYEKESRLKQNLFSSLGFAALYTILAIIIYLVLDSYDVLSRKDNNISEHPLDDTNVSELINT